MRAVIHHNARKLALWVVERDEEDTFATLDPAEFRGNYAIYRNKAEEPRYRAAN